MRDRHALGPPASPLPGIVPSGPTAGMTEPFGSAAYNGSLPPFMLGRSQFKAEIYSGFRYNTDANQAVDTLGSGQGGTTVASSGVRKQSDWSFITQASINHQYTFRGSSQLTWETNSFLSTQRFFRISPNYDLMVADANTGPRFSIAQFGQSKLSVRPFGSVTWVGYEGKTFSTIYGGGLQGELRGSRWWTSMTGLGRFGNYEDSAFRPGIGPYTGPEWQFNLSTTILLGAATQITAAISWYQAASRSSNFSRQGPTGSFSLAKNFLIAQRVAELTASGFIQKLNYGGPPPPIQSPVHREDTQWITDLSIAIPILRAARSPALQSAKAVLEYQYLRNNSNYFAFVDHAVTIGVKITL